jgi:hypothetical protein
MSDEFIRAVREPTSHAFEEFCTKHDLIVTALGIDRHDSYVWEAGADVKGLNRYITWGLTRYQDGPQNQFSLIVSIMTSADDGTFYTNTRFREQVAASIQEYLKRLPERMPEGLETAWRHVLEIVPEMLDQRYIAPRPTPQATPAYS